MHFDIYIDILCVPAYRSRDGTDTQRLDRLRLGRYNRHRAPFVISEGHVLRRWLGIHSFQVRPHRRRPRGGHPLRLFQGERAHLLFQGESARLRHQGGHPTAVVFQGEGAHLRQHGAHPGSVLFPRERAHP